MQLTEKRVINFDELTAMFDFTIGIDTTESHTKKIKLQLHHEVSKNEVTCSALQDMLLPEEIEVNMGSLEGLPSHYSPFYRSKIDLFMYHNEHFTLLQVL